MTPAVKASAYIDTLSILYLNAFKTGKEAMTEGNNDNLVDNFFSCINKIGAYEVLMEKHMDLYRDIISAFKSNMIFENEKMGLIPISSAKPGGTFLCVTKPQKSRETLKKVKEELNTM
jgi:hypothetical protein